ncbi:27700_t:CDS:2, partial [Gigaspora margarita]
HSNAHVLVKLQKQIIINENNSNSFISTDSLVKELSAKIILLEEKTKEIADLTNSEAINEDELGQLSGTLE